MHEAIMGFSSEEFYESSLVADDSVRGHLLQDLPDVDARAADQRRRCNFIDTAGAGYDEELEPDGESRRNPPGGGSWRPARSSSCSMPAFAAATSP